MPTEWKGIRFFNLDELTAARAVLEREGIIHRCLNANPGIGAHYFGQTATPEIRFGPADTERVMQLLDDAGIPVPMPIVDRSEPICPNCDSTLDPDAEEMCPDCGLEFQWVEIEEPAGDTTDKLCVCGYNLTGVARDRCPECNTPIVFPELVETEFDSSLTGFPQALGAIVLLVGGVACVGAVIAAIMFAKILFVLPPLIVGVLLLTLFRVVRRDDDARRSRVERTPSYLNDSERD